MQQMHHHRRQHLHVPVTWSNTVDSLLTRIVMEVGMAEPYRPPAIHTYLDRSDVFHWSDAHTTLSCQTIGVRCIDEMLNMQTSAYGVMVEQSFSDQE